MQVRSTSPPVRPAIYTHLDAIPFSTPEDERGRMQNAILPSNRLMTSIRGVLGDGDGNGNAEDDGDDNFRTSP